MRIKSDFWTSQNGAKKGQNYFVVALPHRNIVGDNLHGEPERGREQGRQRPAGDHS